MNSEIELKLAVFPDFIHFLRQSLTHLRILRDERIFLGNCYYDTADRQLAKQKMGLRVRKQNEQFILTLKTQGEVKGGLHLRPEYDLILASSHFNAQDIAILSQKCGQVLPDFSFLQPHFSTDFERQYWLIECGNGTLIEIAFDQGEICAGTKTQSICEVEFELKQGQVQDLLNFIAELPFENGVRLCAESKAKRGYALLSPLPQMIDWQTKWKDFLQVSLQENEPLATLNQLLQLEQKLIEETFTFGMDYFAQDFLRCVARISAFFNLYHYYQEQPSWLVWLFAQSHLLSKSDLAEFMQNNQWFLDQLKGIIRLHSENQDNQMAMEKLQRLLESRQYVKRLLCLVRLGFA